MAPSKAAANATPMYAKDERVLCFHGEMLYEAKVLDSRVGSEPGYWLFKIHYKGWKNTWDDWVAQDRVMKFTEENKILAAQLDSQMNALRQKGPSKSDKKKGARANASDNSSLRGSEERHASVAAQPHRNKRTAREYELEPEENFHARPTVRIPIPDHLKAMLVDDWENVTKNQMLVPIPCAKPVNKILDDYLAAERPKRLVPNAQGKNGASSQADILTEVVAGLREYFEKSLGRILLYKFERNQYLTVFNQMNSGEGEFAGKEIGDIYGAEHFCRLLVTLPELIAQTNMSKDAVTHLREEIATITNWLAKNAVEYFVSAYEHPGQDYIENARHT